MIPETRASRLALTAVLALLPVAPMLAGGPIEAALDGFLAEVHAPRAPGSSESVSAWADLRAGGLHEGSPIVSRQAAIGNLGRGLRCLYLNAPGDSSVGLFPQAPETAHAATLEVLAASSRTGARFDVLVDQRVVARDVPVSSTEFTPIRVDLSEDLPLGRHRVEVRLAPDSPPLGVLALKVSASSGRLPAAPVALVRQAFQERLGREPTLSELAAAAPEASEEGEKSFLEKLMHKIEARFAIHELTRIEAVQFRFDRGRLSGRMKKRLAKSSPEVLGVLSNRAQQVLASDTSLGAIHKAKALLKIMEELGIPTDPPPATEPVLDPPGIPPEVGGAPPPQEPPPPPDDPPPPPPPPPDDPPPPPPPPPPDDPPPPPPDDPPPPPPPPPPPDDPPPPPPPPPDDPPPPPPPPPDDPPPPPPPPPDDPVDPSAIPIREYYPVDVGRTWNYVDPIKNEDFLIKVEEHLSFAGTSVAKFRRNDKVAEYDYISVDGPLKLWLRHDDTNGNLDWSDDPVPFAQAETVAIGDKYEAVPKSYTNPVTGGNFRWIIQIKKLQDVTIPYGEVKNALRIDVKNIDTASGAEVSKFSMYFGHGIGLVSRKGRFISSTFDQQLKAVVSE